MIISYTNKENRTISDTHFKELVEERASEWLKDEIWLEDWCYNNNYTISKVIFFTEEEKEKMLAEFRKETFEEAEWDIITSEGWVRNEIDW